MKPTDVKSNSFAECNVESNEKHPKFKISDHLRISKYKNIFEEVIVIQKLKILYHGLIL